MSDLWSADWMSMSDKQVSVNSARKLFDQSNFKVRKWIWCHFTIIPYVGDGAVTAGLEGRKQIGHFGLFYRLTVKNERVTNYWLSNISPLYFIARSVAFIEESNDNVEHQEL